MRDTHRTSSERTEFEVRWSSRFLGWNVLFMFLLFLVYAATAVFASGYFRLLGLALAIVFAVLHCGFEPCSALEAAGSGRSRFNRLMALIGECTLSIHDLSRVELDTHTKLPRFNMPWELGVCMGAREFGDKTQQKKDFLILERSRGDCFASCSDLGGIDPEAHGNSPVSVIQHVRVWLTGHAKNSLAGPEAINSDYKSFQRDLPGILETPRIRRDEMTFVDLRRAVKAWLAARPKA